MYSTQTSTYSSLFLIAASSMLVSNGIDSSNRWMDDWLQTTMSGRLSVAAKDAGKQ